MRGLNIQSRICRSLIASKTAHAAFRCTLLESQLKKAGVDISHCITLTNLRCETTTRAVSSRQLDAVVVDDERSAA
ncbi:hypothetical protein PHLCEN_2v6304 [Hermanssonia centrifuga]|uniref:Uncharacterized protein n=1 Tax=Hermanssonia centrifuga TaxID=98765 RepID=A0A2R6NZT0_9APHY|nr:hypothetical protein PHLCEN_2v6304 [Hermanssonia centrifuga]